MIDLNYTFKIIFPDRRDPATGRWRCRWCGKPVIPPGDRPRKYYCNDDCYSNCVKALSWGYVRKLVFNRDDGICQMCGEKVYLFGGGGEIEDELKWYNPEYHDEYRKYHQGVRKAEIHHIIPCKTLSALAYKVTKDIEDEELRKHWDWKLTAMLQLDINNLTTLCKNPCHDAAHNHHANLIRKAKLNHKLLTEFETPNIRLTEDQEDGS